jgi:hypothetical protein
LSEKEPSVPVKEGRLSPSRAGRFEEKNLLLLPGIKPQFLGCLARSLIIALTTVKLKAKEEFRYNKTSRNVTCFAKKDNYTCLLAPKLSGADLLLLIVWRCSALPWHNLFTTFPINMPAA